MKVWFITGTSKGFSRAWAARRETMGVVDKARGGQLAPFVKKQGTRRREGEESV